MYPERIQKLIDLLIRLPGVGPRQAARMVYRLLDEKDDFKKDVSEGILKLKDLKKCAVCYKTHEEKENLCGICRRPDRNEKVYMLVEKDMDLDAIEKAGVHDGYYFVLGGTLSPLAEENYKNLRLKEFAEFAGKNSNIEEIILATSATPEGDFTAGYVEKALEPVIKKRAAEGKTFLVTRLGRGLSTGLELEYSDRETFRNAYISRRAR